MVVLALGAAVFVAVPPSAGVAARPEASAAVLAAPALAADRDTGGPAARLAQVASPGSAAPVRPAAPALPQVTTTARPGSAAAVAVEFALAQRGLPYVWGGNGPQQGHRGFDCSGLTTYSYKHAGIDLPRTAHTQYYAGPHVPANAELLPGDLVFYGVPKRVHHVGLYIGNGQMVAAPTFGKPVRISYVRYTGDDYLGATRPAAGRDADLLATPELPVVVPPVPSPEVPPAPEEFAAPEVPRDQVVEPPVVQSPVTSDDDASAIAAQAEGAPDPVSDGPITASGIPSSAGSAPPTVSPTAQAAVPAGADAPSSDAPSSGAAATTAPSSPPSPSAAAPSAAAPSAAAPSAAAPSAAAPSAAAPSAAAPSGAAPSGAAPSGAAAGVEGATAPVTPKNAAEVSVPAAVVLPGGAELDLAAAERDERGLPVTPEAAGAGGLRWSPAAEGRAARAVVAVGPDAVAGIEVGSVVGLRGADGGVVELTVRSRELVAGDLAFPRGDGTRLVLVVADSGTGEVLVLIAE